MRNKTLKKWFLIQGNRNRFETRKEAELGLEKQRRPLEIKRIEVGATDEGSDGGEGKSSLRR